MDVPGPGHVVAGREHPPLRRLVRDPRRRGVPGRTPGADPRAALGWPAPGPGRDPRLRAGQRPALGSATVGAVAQDGASSALTALAPDKASRDTRGMKLYFAGPLFSAAERAWNA